MASRAKKKIFKSKKKQHRLPQNNEEEEQVPIKSDPQIIVSPQNVNPDEEEEESESDTDTDSSEEEEENGDEDEEEEEKKGNIGSEKGQRQSHIDIHNTHSINTHEFDETSQDNSFWKYNDNNLSYSSRLIERGSGSHPNVIMKGHVHSYLYLYHSIIDTPWVKLFFYGFLLFFLFNVFFGTIFHLINGVTWIEPVLFVYLYQNPFLP